MPAQEDKGIYLGVFAGEGADAAPVRLRYKGPKHILCFGPPGANKSMGLIVPNIAHLPRSMIVIDPKGQLAAITARKRARMGRVIVLNPFDIFVDQLPRMRSAGWNPLLQLDPRSHDFSGDALCIADAVIERTAGGGGTNSAFFQNSAEALMMSAAMFERDTKGDRASLRNVRAEIASPSFLDMLKRMAESDNYAIRTAGGRLYARLTDANSHSTSAQDVVDTCLSETRFLDDPRIGADMAEGGAIDFGALHREIVTIYLILPVHELTAQAKWLRLFVNLALRGLYKSPPTSGATLPRCLMILDEFPALGRLQEIVKALGAARDYSIALFMVLQSKSQLAAHYEKEVSLFFAGSGAVTCFAPAKDLDTAEHLAKIIGNREEMVQTETSNGGSLTPQAVPLIRPEDLMRLPRGMTANLIEPCPWPVLAHCPVYTKTLYGAGLDANPYYRGP
jgi:type IV secretion system protein VirD4